ncbi:MAG TPA: thioredoxin family protein [Thermoplasmata archaeon]|nr:thioredoxin family protein [Thermoplasmata archaeon]
MAELDRFRLHPGDPAPDFDLPNVDGKRVKMHDYDRDPFLLVVFWCNHCPYVQAWEGRMLELARRYRSKGVATVLINANDPVAYPDDRPERMVERARSKSYPAPYLWDETQSVAHAYGALVTPHPMLFDRDRRLLFQGRIDDNNDHPDAVKHRFLEAALDAAIAGKRPEPTERSVLGCSVKWRA